MRHGDVDYRAAEGRAILADQVPLTAECERQAGIVGDVLRDIGLTEAQIVALRERGIVN
jgi:broad specificity phosphatase PhoE